MFEMEEKNKPIAHVERHPHRELAFLDNVPGKKKVVLVGNPNVGKSILFNKLSGVYVDVSNYPGTTVSLNRGSYKHYEVFDTPGV